MTSHVSHASAGEGDWIKTSSHVCRLDNILSPSSAAYLILDKQRLSDTVVRLTLHAPLVALNAQPGQFVLIRPTERSERIPLTISHADRVSGAVTVIFQEVGHTTRELGGLEKGQSVQDFAGPLGTPSDIQRVGTVACVAGGVGIAVMLPVTRALKAAGNRIIGILGARNKSLLILEDEMREACDELAIVTDDGSYGEQGIVTDALAALTQRDRIDMAYAIGPLPMMQAVCDVTRDQSIATVVSLDPVMVDGTGMCGGCRVRVGGDVKFACVDGPEFDGHLVDWDSLRSRKAGYREQEQKAREASEEAHHA
ncbi:MAG: sulfide/dihydroorotate dehydrogenase-like FAD/NAD-binding protein [Armatimonadetes bacterium]|nr:sulfide/dihydroorotate dehydrogenase-like FAD/NAD-binding protein [Armatimonadota bacterium]